MASSRSTGAVTEIDWMAQHNAALVEEAAAAATFLRDRLRRLADTVGCSGLALEVQLPLP